MSNLSPAHERKPHASVIASETEILRALVAQSTLPAEAKAVIEEKLAQLQDLVSHKPLSLADIGAIDTLAAAGTTEAERFGVDETFIQVEKGFEPHEQDKLQLAWHKLLWLARKDMSEDEILILTEKTFTRLATGYKHDNVPGVTLYWQYLVRLRKEKLAIQAACGGGQESPKERNAGAVVASKAKASQRTEALPGGVESGCYAPEVYSPTAAMWMSASQRAASTRQTSEKAGSVAPTRKSKSPGRRAADAAASSPGAGGAGGSPAATTADGKLRKGSGRLQLETSGKGFQGSGPAFKNTKGWQRF